MENNRKSSIFFYAAFFCAAILLGAYMLAQFNGARDVSFSWYAPPRLLDQNLQPVTKVVPGQYVFMEYSVSRSSERCWSSQSELLSGRVTVQFERTTSQIFEDHATQFRETNMFTIPHGLPPGKYRWYRIVFPTCDGEFAAPQRLDTGIDIEVLADGKAIRSAEPSGI